MPPIVEEICTDTDRRGTYFYGIDDDNAIWELDPLANGGIGEMNMIYDAKKNDGMTEAGGANGIAYDYSTDSLYFFYQGKKAGLDNKNQTLWRLSDLTRQSRQRGIGLVQVGVRGNVGNQNDTFGNTKSANAAFWDNSVWYMSENNKKLYELVIADDPKQSELITHDLSLTQYPAGGYGDIAIDFTSGILYGNQVHNKGTFYSIDLRQVRQAKKNGVQVPKDAYKFLGKTKEVINK